MSLSERGSLSQESTLSNLNLKLLSFESKYSNFLANCASLLEKPSNIPADESTFDTQAEKCNQATSQLRLYKTKVNLAIKYLIQAKQSLGLKCSEEMIQAIEAVQRAASSLDDNSLLEFIEGVCIENARLKGIKKENSQKETRNGKMMQSLMNEYNGLSEQMNSVRNSVFELTNGFSNSMRTTYNRFHANKNDTEISKIDYIEIVEVLSTCRKEILNLPNIESEWKSRNLGALIDCEQQIEMISSELFHQLNLMRKIIAEYSDIEQYVEAENSLYFARTGNIEALKRELLNFDMSNIISLKNQEIYRLKTTNYAAKYNKLLKEHENLKELYDKQIILERRFKFIIESRIQCLTSANNSYFLKIRLECLLKGFISFIDSSFTSISQKLYLIMERQQKLQLTFTQKLKENLSVIVSMNETFAHILSYKQSLAIIQEEKDYLEYTINQQTEAHSRQAHDFLDTIELLEVDNQHLSEKILSISQSNQTLEQRIEEIENDKNRQTLPDLNEIEELKRKITQLTKSSAEKEFEYDTISYEKGSLELYNNQLVDKCAKSQGDLLQEEKSHQEELQQANLTIESLALESNVKGLELAENITSIKELTLKILNESTVSAAVESELEVLFSILGCRPEELPDFKIVKEPKHVRSSSLAT